MSSAGLHDAAPLEYLDVVGLERKPFAIQLPLPWKEASAEAVNAVAYATKYHAEWFWKGAQHLRKWRTAH